MRLSHDYTDFFDLHEADAQLARRTHQDFISACSATLLRLGAAADAAVRISASLYAHMTEPARHYHTAVHVLAMFAHAQHAGLRLTDPEQLAVWFHDAIYEPASAQGYNENASADWMVEQLAGTGIDAATIEQAAAIVRSTALHLRDDVPPAHAAVMDLDLIGMASASDNFDRQSKAVRDEMTNLTDAQYNAGKVAFFKALLQRSRIFRTQTFADHEAAARQQIADEIARLSGSNGASH